MVDRATAQYHTIQDHAKIKLAYEITPTIKASYTYGVWRNNMNSSADSYLRDVTGATVYSAATSTSLVVNSRLIRLISPIAKQLATRHAWPERERAIPKVHLIGKSLAYLRLPKDIARAPTVAIPTADTGGAGRITDGSGTGWNTLALKGIWRPNTEHTAEFTLSTRSLQTTHLGIEHHGLILGALYHAFLRLPRQFRAIELYAQDAWRINPEWKPSSVVVLNNGQPKMAHCLTLPPLCHSLNAMRTTSAQGRPRLSRQ